MYRFVQMHLDMSDVCLSYLQVYMRILLFINLQVSVCLSMCLSMCLSTIFLLHLHLCQCLQSSREYVQPLK